MTPVAANEAYEYDGLDRLERATRGALQSPAARSEAWTLDHLGNWTEHYLNANDDGAVDLLDRSTRSHNATNEIESVTDAAGLTQAYLFDDRGAVQAEPLPNEGTLERRRVHQRDLWGRLVTITEQMRPDAQSPWSHAGDVAAYTYYAGNQLATRRADQDGDGVLETTTLYFYDSDWNLLEEQEFIDASPAPDLTVDSDLIRQHLWDPTSSNELTQTRSMVLSGGSYSTPLPVWAATDRRRDVVALRYDLLGGALTGTFRMRYAPYGEPEPVLAGDLNGDGVLSADDNAALAAIRATAQPSLEVHLGDASYAPDADLNFDGVIDGLDTAALGALVSNGGESIPGELWGQGANTQLRGMTIGYAGMPYDEQARAYLMRNRWHSPTLGRFLSRDPAGFVDGLSLYAYVTGNPLKYWDPFGLISCRVDRIDESDPRYYWDPEKRQVYHVADVYRRGWFGFGPERYQGTKKIYDPLLQKGDVDGQGRLTNRHPNTDDNERAVAAHRQLVNGAQVALGEEANMMIAGAAVLPAGRAGSKGLGKAVDELGEAAGEVSGRAGRGGGRSSGPPELPVLDQTGKVHGDLPRPQDLGSYSPEDLVQLRNELQRSVQQRIRVTTAKGSDRAHGQRQGAEQDLIKSIEKHLEDR